MPRNNPKPTDKTEWDATGNINSPSAGRKTSGWLFNVKPPAEMFNWFWNLTGLNQVYHNAQVQDWIVIDTDADEGDYATLTAYLTDAPAAGNRVLIKEDQTVTAQTVIPDDITLKFLDGSRLLCATNIATSVLQFGSNVIIEGVLNVVLSQTGVTAKAVELNGDNVTGKINVENSSTGTLTTGYHINASKTGNRVEGFIDNTGGGTLTNRIIDNSGEATNNFIIIDNPNSLVVRSGDIVSGTYNAVATSGPGGGNLDSTPADHTAQFMRVGNTVTVSGEMTIDPTNTATATNFRLTLPVASNFVATGEASGIAGYVSVSSAIIDGFRVSASTISSEVIFIGYPTDVGAALVNYTYTYTVI